MNILNQRKGFSLIELLVALSILAVVAAIIVPRFLNVRTSAAETSGVAQLKEMQHIYENWLGLGGIPGNTNAGDMLMFLSEQAAGNPLARAAVNGWTDSQNTPISSASINFSGTVNSANGPYTVAGLAGNATQPGFYANPGGTGYYSDGSGDVWYIAITNNSLTATQTPGATGGAVNPNNTATDIK